jgi:hypothetical protein
VGFEPFGPLVATAWCLESGMDAADFALLAAKVLDDWPPQSALLDLLSEFGLASFFGWDDLHSSKTRPEASCAPVLSPA